MEYGCRMANKTLIVYEARCKDCDYEDYSVHAMTRSHHHSNNTGHSLEVKLGYYITPKEK